MLSLTNPSLAFANVDDDDRMPMNLGSIANRDGTSGGNMSRVSCINESGLYSLILKSRKPEAKRFKEWVTSGVLRKPATRRLRAIQRGAGSRP